jgi:hypothetical protein
MSLKAITLTACGLLAMSALGESEYYTWVDKDGVTNYAETPTDSDAHLVTRSHRFGYPTPEQDPESATADTATTTGTPAEVDPDKLIAGEKAQMEAAISETKNFNCNIGKTNLARLQTYGRVKIKGEDGNYRIMTPDEMDMKKEESRTLIKENCTG